MSELNDLLADLSSRLPELEWKIKGLGASFPVYSLPRGVFQTPFGVSGATCIAEIKSDILALSRQKNQRSATFLASRIQQKINVLVGLCQMHQRKNNPADKPHFGLSQLSTRQQWIQSLEEEIDSLASQRQALLRVMEQMKLGVDATSVLSVQKELGQLEKQLTLAREALAKAVS